MTITDMSLKIKQLARDLYKIGRDAVVISHKQQRLINQLHESIHKEPVMMVVCENIHNCRNHQLHCDRCEHNRMLTYESDWLPPDWYCPAFATGGVVTGPPIVIPEVDGAFCYERDCHIDPHGRLEFGPWKVGKDSMTCEANVLYNCKVVNQQLKNQQNMKNEPVNFWNEMLNKSISINGKPYRLVPVEAELTLEDCVKGSGYWIRCDGSITCQDDMGYISYPTAAIAEKVLLYGLLQSVAEKLNQTGIFGAQPAGICHNQLSKRLTATKFNGTYTISPVFLGLELAEKAILIFAKSKFDLKKLYQ